MTKDPHLRFTRRVALWLANLLRRWAFWLDKRTARPVELFDFESEPLTDEEWETFRRAVGIEDQD